MLLLAEHADTFQKLLPTILTVLGTIVASIVGGGAIFGVAVLNGWLGKKANKQKNEIDLLAASTANWTALTAPMAARLSTVEAANDTLRDRVDKADSRIDQLERELTKKDSLIRALVAYVRLLREHWGAPSIPAIPPELGSDI